MNSYSYENLTQHVEAYIEIRLTAAVQLGEADHTSVVASACGAYRFWFRLTRDAPDAVHLDSVRRQRALIRPRR